MTVHPSIPSALTIAGSDSGGGAGLQADLRTFAAFGVHGLSAITCLTAQDPKAVRAIEPVKASMVQAQIECARAAFRPAAGKIGMLYSARVVRAVADSVRRIKRMPWVIDPVLVSSSGAPLLQRSAFQSLKTELLPLAALMTPNIPEAETLTGRTIRNPEGMRAAARQLFDQFGCAVLVKGGHLKGGGSAVDILYDGREEHLLAMPRSPGPSMHGTGCTLSAAITAGLARGDNLLHAIQTAKEFTARAITRHRRVRGQRVLALA